MTAYYTIKSRNKEKMSIPVEVVGKSGLRTVLIKPINGEGQMSVWSSKVIVKPCKQPKV